MFAGLFVQIADSAQGGRIVGPFVVGQLDDLVGGDAHPRVMFVFLNHLVGGVGFHSGNEEDALAGQGKEPGENDIGLVHDDDGALGQAQDLGRVALVTFGLSDCDKSWQIAVMIQWMITRWTN